MSTLQPDGFFSALPQGENIIPVPSTSLPYFVRSMRSPDLVSAAEVLASSFHDSSGAMGWLYPLLRMGIYEDLRSRLHSKSPHHACLVAVQRSSLLTEDPKAVGSDLGKPNPIVGTIELALKFPYPWHPLPARYLYISNLAVQANYRRQGVALQLLQTFERVALSWGFKDLYLHVLEDNHQARRLYQKAGYQTQQASVNFVSLVLRRPRQLFLHKRLS